MDGRADGTKCTREVIKQKRSATAMAYSRNHMENVNGKLGLSL